MNIGFIGLGIMGSRMAHNLLKAGYSLTVYNRSREKAEPLLAAGAQWAESPAALAKETEVIITMLENPTVVRQLGRQEDGFLDSRGVNKLWIDCSTVDPAFSKEMAQAARKRGFRYLEAPVAGTKGPAEKGELVFFVGGEAADLAQAEPLLDAMGKKTIHLGEVGKGASIKLLVNLMLAQGMLAFAETIKLGKSLGLPSETMMNILLNTPVAPAFLSAIRSKLEAGDTEANFPLRLIRKDLNLVSATAYEAGISLPLAQVAKEIYTMAQEAGRGDEDFSAVYAFLAADHPANKK